MRIVLCLLLLTSTAFAACTGSSPTWSSTVDSTSVNTCISSSSAGDTINVSGGSATWASVTFSGRNLNCTATCTISGQAVVMNQSTSAVTQLSGFTFTTCGTDGTPDVSLNGDGTMLGGRIYNNTFTNTSSSCIFIVTNMSAHNSTTAYPIQLIDHNTLTSGPAAEMIHVDAYGAGNGIADGWPNDVTPGGANMTFIENNVATCPFAQCNGQALNNLSQSYNGARTVVRYNHLTMAQVDQHGTSTSFNVRWFEIYSNTFNDGGMEQAAWAELRGGTGIVYNNSVTWSGGYGPPDFGMQDEVCGTYPDPAQIGRGINSGGYKSSPVYFWNNTPSGSAPVSVEDCATNIQINRDYFNSGSAPATITRCQSAADVTAGCPVTYTYTAYTYPHPLDNCNTSQFGAGATCGGPAPPDNLTGAVLQGGTIQ